MKLPLLLAAALVLAGCATPAPVAKQRTTATLAAPREKVWPLILAEIGLKYPVQVVEKESGLITTTVLPIATGPYNRGAEAYVVTPSVLLGVFQGLRVSLSVLAVEPEPGRTQVTINLRGEVYETNVRKSWLAAESTGAVENAILTALERKLSPAAAP